MKNIWKTILMAMSAIALLALAPVARADGVSGGSGDNGDLRLSVGSLTGILENGEPEITFLAPASVGQVEYEVEFERVFEFQDSSGDKRFQSSEKLAQADLEQATWTNTGFQEMTDSSGNRIGLSITLSVNPATLRVDRASDGGQVTVPSTFQLQFVVKAFETPQTITVPDGRSFDISGAEVKIDIVIQDWPFIGSSGSMLAVQVDLDSEVEQFEVEDGNDTVSVDGSRIEDQATAEHNIDDDTSDVENEVRFSNGFVTASSTVGFFRFVDTATVTSDSTTTTVPVTASFKVETEDNETEFKLYLAYPRFVGRLEHDPSFAIVNSGVPSLFLVIGGAALAGLVTMVAIRRRRPTVDHEKKPVAGAGTTAPTLALSLFTN